MKIAFHGAARTVTGSKHLIHLDNGKQVLLDCGMFQGMGKDTDALNRDFGFEAAKISYLILSHAHIDHCGLIPKLVKEGFAGTIFCTPATKELAAILLQDSAEIQRDDTKFINKKRAKQGLTPYQPLYTPDDVAETLSHFESVAYDEWTKIDEEMELMFADAGHIIGSASVHLKITAKGHTTRVSFSGDVGRYNDAILRKPTAIPRADYLILESTYGNRLHEDVADATQLFYHWIHKTCIQKKGKLIIPAFSVGRTQEVLYSLNQLELEKRLPPVPVYVDSPLSKEATDLVKSYPQYFNDAIHKVMLTDSDPFDFRGLKFIQSVEESKRLNDLDQPCVIISASGMADAGRVKHHIRNNIGDEKNTVLMVGYCEPNSLGGKLLSGAKSVKIFGEMYKVVAEIGRIYTMSAHGDYDDLCLFIAGQEPSELKNLFLVHGDYDVQEEFASRLHGKGFKHIQIPERHSEFTLQ
ncbi:MBL fold metallo-hydrolase [Sediminibacterium soli]|uniref:MBL fold metallo-hydrolase n=1 Tax=Sediminibacterium soli TaxID=2698829 RepID=UPI00137AF077|nr:MBL fold metallo-hydrolase [Sediminibacterium soli]NCI47213.1 MBL fold metallo-hydrolase [Sediminibacterium soli]